MKRAVAIAILIAAFVVYRPIARWAVTPSETRAPWVEQLATIGSGFHGHAECSPSLLLDPFSRESYGPIIVASNEQKRRLWEIYTSKKGRYGLASRYSTVEGAWIYNWLLVEDGKLRFIHDHTRDGGAPATAVETYTLKGARLGFLSDSKFIEGQPGADDSPILVFELDTGRRKSARF